MWKLTNELRWDIREAETFCEGVVVKRAILQQKWVRGVRAEWRDVPEEKGGFKFIEVEDGKGTE